jgi:hypothetical protein
MKNWLLKNCFFRPAMFSIPTFVGKRHSTNETWMEMKARDNFQQYGFTGYMD